jgi:cysteine-rich repeat protein
MLKISLVIFFSVATLAGSVSSGTSTSAASPLPDATAVKLDGAFTEAAWEHVPAVSDFRQREPKDGADPSFATDVQVVYDASNLYIAVRAHDPKPDRIVGMRTRRDSESPSDWLRVIIDSFHDRRTAFEFGVNPAGVKQDRAWSDDGNTDSNDGCSGVCTREPRISRVPSGNGKLTRQLSRR